MTNREPESPQLPLAGIERAEKDSAEPSTAAEPRPAPRLKPINRQQLILRPTVAEDLLEPDHPARAIWELVDKLDLSLFYKDIKAVEGSPGQNANDPQLLICLWIYAYSEGVSAAREVGRRCEYHPAYLWLTGLKGVNYHSLSTFRVQYREALNGLFAQVLAVMQSQGLMELQRVTQDGTKIQAAASRRSLHREKTLQKHLQEAQQRVQELEEQGQQEDTGQNARQRAAQERAAREKLEQMQAALEELAQVQKEQNKPRAPEECRVSESEPEARKMKHSDGSFSPSYNAQLVADAKADLIVAAQLTQARNDEGLLGAGLDEVQRVCQQTPKEALVDDGYVNRATVLETHRREVELIGSGQLDQQHDPEKTARNCENRGVAPAFYPQEFHYDAEHDLYVCPAGQELPHRGVKQDRPGVERHQYRAKTSTCRICRFQNQCCPRSGKKFTGGRIIVRSQNDPLVDAYVEKMKTPQAQAIYQQRKRLAEFPNLWIKEKLGLRRFRVRGLVKAGCELLWACLAYNLQQWIRLRWRPALVTAAAA